MVTRMRFTMMRMALVVAAGLGIGSECGLFAADAADGQVWLISTRRAPLFCSNSTDPAAFDYWRLSADNQWLSADMKAFLAADQAAVPTVFYIHGNRSDHCDAVNDGSGFRQLLSSQAPGRPFRYVIWSWPADRVSGGNRYDVQVKACRSDGQSCHLAQLLDRMHPAVPVTLAGYSFGARIITGALHMLAGGEVAGQVLAPRTSPTRRVPVRAVLVASALDCDWLLPNRTHGLALSQIDRALVTVNGSDPVLKRYPMMYSLRGPQALGYVGPACSIRLGSDGEKLELLDMSCSTGGSHSWDCYLAPGSLRARLAWYAFLEPSPPASPPATASAPQGSSAASN